MAMDNQEEELCSICLDSLPRLASKFVRMTCCGKGLHLKCYDNIFKSSMSHKQKNQCIMCRTVSHKSEEEQTANGFVDGLRKEKHGRRTDWVTGTARVSVLINRTNKQQSCSNCPRARVMPVLSTIWVSCTTTVKVWIKITREQKNITRQQQGRERLVRSTVWVVSITAVRVSSNPMKQLESGG